MILTFFCYNFSFKVAVPYAVEKHVHLAGPSYGAPAAVYGGHGYGHGHGGHYASFSSLGHGYSYHH